MAKSLIYPLLHQATGTSLHRGSCGRFPGLLEVSRKKKELHFMKGTEHLTEMKINDERTVEHINTYMYI